MIGRRAAGLVVVLLLGGCGSGSTSSSSEPTTTAPAQTLDEAARRLREFIDATVAEVLPGKPTELADGSGRQLCNSEVNDDQFEAYNVFIDVRPSEMTSVLERTRRYWGAQGYEDRRSGSGVTISFDGEYTAGMTGFPADAEVSIGGATPCFAPQ